ncbi:unnamed protein product [Acanthocheilonema viteae]|uniref:Uncharacterized protein n=1 Tax=Acanthocheilonema viteae TaxID=6277 RepID=A0A498SIJ0_ACAVI|nr:unnamed protein product [Acanthocheilonema viteae]
MDCYVGGGGGGGGGGEMMMMAMVAVIAMMMMTDDRMKEKGVSVMVMVMVMMIMMTMTMLTFAFLPLLAKKTCIDTIDRTYADQPARILFLDLEECMKVLRSLELCDAMQCDAMRPVSTNETRAAYGVRSRDHLYRLRAAAAAAHFCDICPFDERVAEKRKLEEKDTENGVAAKGAKIENGIVAATGDAQVRDLRPDKNTPLKENKEKTTNENHDGEHEEDGEEAADGEEGIEESSGGEDDESLGDEEDGGSEDDEASIGSEESDGQGDGEGGDFGDDDDVEGEEGGESEE